MEKIIVLAGFISTWHKLELFGNRNSQWENPSVWPLIESVCWVFSRSVFDVGEPTYWVCCDTWAWSPQLYKKVGWLSHARKSVTREPLSSLLKFLPACSCLEVFPWLPSVSVCDLRLKRWIKSFPLLMTYGHNVLLQQYKTWDRISLKSVF